MRSYIDETNEVHPTLEPKTFRLRLPVQTLTLQLAAAGSAVGCEAAYGLPSVKVEIDGELVGSFAVGDRGQSTAVTALLSVDLLAASGHLISPSFALPPSLLPPSVACIGHLRYEPQVPLRGRGRAAQESSEKLPKRLLLHANNVIRTDSDKWQLKRSQTRGTGTQRSRSLVAKRTLIASLITHLSCLLA